ncbi:amidase family protein [Muriicola sp. Z0-33]|uniref:amidase family protein n=1 Tax=Muriicola sp. Z0-33 TaxID=2816957 RepID=UPI0022382C05|nr:amidase family protein [Muriicola sp. Z0-33]MCW5517361.1 amidase [Muriicola sp. Z0-33]
MKNIYLILIFLLICCVGCKNKVSPEITDEIPNRKEASVKDKLWEPYNDSTEVAANKDHEKGRMRYKLIQSKVLDKNEVFNPLYKEVAKMSEEKYNALLPLILEQDIPSLQEHINEGKLNYEELVLFYLYRIYKYELNNETTLNTVIALNENVVDEARKLDELRNESKTASHHPIYGMPVLLKDNINTEGMATTAGSIALLGNDVADAFIVQRLKEHGALILGKVNLSEWAYFMCSGCPVGYSAVGGQTLNPYGRRVFETGGSSSGSGTSMAANFAVAAVGTETSGSILSPSSQNSVVGLKPTVGLLSRSGIVPISSTLDTPGPMTRNVVDNGILLDAMRGFDETDDASVQTDWEMEWYKAAEDYTGLKGKRFGVFEDLLESDSIYNSTVEALRNAGATIFPFTPPEAKMDGFISILNIDMKNDLPNYLATYAKNKGIEIKDIPSLVAFNNKDSLIRIPYGHALFEGILADTTTAEELNTIKKNLEKNGRIFFNEAMNKHRLDAILSINNYHAGYAAVAKYPALTVPMGYKPSGEPISLTFIGKQYQEAKLLHLGKAYEDAFPVRKIPADYK